MANEVGNSELVTTWAFTGTKTEPDPSKFDQGWFLGERPPFEYMNWLQNDFGKKLNQLLTFGGAEWNATTEYPPGAMVTDGGSSWQSQATNTNSPPTAVNVNWAIVLTSAVASGALLAVNNLSDLDDAAIARSNLGLGGVAVLNNVPITRGGTGATSASGARSNLGLGNVATENIVPITKGGTGSTTASTARTALGLGSASVENLTDNDDLSVNPSDVGTRGNMAAAIAASAASAPNIIIHDQKPPLTAGGTFLAGQRRTRVLNTIVRDDIGISLSSNQIVGLPAGMYYAKFSCSYSEVGGNIAYLRNNTSSSDLVTSLNGYGDVSGNSVPVSGSGVFTISTATNITLQHICQTSVASYGFGRPNGTGGTELYSEITIWRA